MKNFANLFQSLFLWNYKNAEAYFFSVRKALPLLLLFLIPTLFVGQGLEFMPQDEYKKLSSPPMLCGAGPEETSLPEKYVIPASAFPKPGSQGAQSSCTAWATGYYLMSFYQGQVNKWSLKDTNHIFSPSYIYQNIKKCEDCHCGTYIGNALDFLKNSGNVSIDQFPYSASKCDAPNETLKKTAGKYKITGWSRVEDVHNLTDIKSYLSQGIPVVIASSTNKEFSAFKNKTETDVFKWNSGNYKGGGHAMLLVGYDNKLGAFKLLNSWGTGWGSKGYAWVDYASFRLMINEAYVAEKNYIMSDATPEPRVDPVVKKTTITKDNFRVYAYREKIRESRYYFTFGVAISKAVQSQVSKVVYVYDNPIFRYKYINSYKKPNYTTSYEGSTCLKNMKAIVHFTDGTQIELDFDACALSENQVATKAVDLSAVEINPIVVAEPTSEAGRYDFKIKLRGIELVKDEVEKVVYDRNDPSFKTRYVTTTNKENNFEGGYNGWGCLYSLNVTIHFKDQTTKTFSIDMCKALGW